MLIHSSELGSGRAIRARERSDCGNMNEMSGIVVAGLAVSQLLDSMIKKASLHKFP
jgi:hypothetical protein